MAARRSTIAQVSVVLLACAPLAQLLGSLGFWFFITRGDPTTLVLGLASGGGLLGVLGLPFVLVALVLALRGRMKAAGVLALIGGVVSAISIVAVAAGVCLMLSPEARARVAAPNNDGAASASGAAMGS